MLVQGAPGEWNLLQLPLTESKALLTQCEQWLKKNQTFIVFILLSSKGSIPGYKSIKCWKWVSQRKNEDNSEVSTVTDLENNDFFFFFFILNQMKMRKKISRERSGKRVDWTFEFQEMLEFPSGNIQEVTGNAWKKVKTKSRSVGMVVVQKGMATYYMKRNGFSMVRCSLRTFIYLSKSSGRVAFVYLRTQGEN